MEVARRGFVTRRLVIDGSEPEVTVALVHERDDQTDLPEEPDRDEVAEPEDEESATEETDDDSLADEALDNGEQDEP